MLREGRPAALWLLGALWVGLLVAGFAVLFRYNSTAEANPLPPPRWPSSTSLERVASAPTLVVFAHPRCACTRATLAELGRMLPRLAERPKTFVVFLVPSGTSSDWEETDLWRSAKSIPGVTVLADRDGTEAALFHVATSGATLVYSAAGDLLFHGGITASRGHEGDSFGQHRIASLLASGHADRTESPVFGCALRETQRAAEETP